MDLIAIVASPLQALNVLEYSERFGRKIDLVVVGGVSELEPSSRIQIEEVLSFLRPRQIIYVDFPRTRRLHKVRSTLTSGISEVERHLSATAYEIIVGEYRSPFPWSLLGKLSSAPRSVVVVDDGTATLRMDRRRRMPRSREGWRLELRRNVFRMLGIHAAPPRSGLVFFTTYAIDGSIAEGDTIVRNDYRTLKASFKDLLPDEDAVYVLGADVTSPHRVESAEKASYELRLALELGHFAAEETGKKVIYVAHRRERSEKLDALRKEFTVVTPAVPFEIFPRTIGKQPRAIVTYCSSALVTAAELFGESVELIALQLPRENLNDSWARVIDGIYDYYQREVPKVRVVENPCS